MTVMWPMGQTTTAHTTGTKAGNTTVGNDDHEWDTKEQHTCMTKRAGLLMTGRMPPVEVLMVARM
eukprot:8459076-Alexandrium_andersonii.AAC.1